MTVYYIYYLEITTEEKMNTPTRIGELATAALLDSDATVETYRKTLQDIIQIVNAIKTRLSANMREYEKRRVKTEEEKERQREKARQYYYANREKVLARARIKYYGISEEDLLSKLADEPEPEEGVLTGIRKVVKKKSVAGGGASST